MAYRQLVSNVRFGSLAALSTNTSLMSASGGKAVVQARLFRIRIASISGRTLNVCFHQ